MLRNKVIIVTGGSGLIGSAIVQHLKEQEAIVLNLDIDQETDLKQRYIHCDITSMESIDDAISLIIESFGKIDGLVNNAYPRTKDWGTPLEDIQYTSWQKNVDMQMNSTFYLCQKLIKEMAPRGGGSIVNITSIYGVVGNDWTIYEGTNIGSAAAYSAIKGGIISFTRYLASLCGKDKIRVNCVSPGGIFDHQAEPFVKAYERKVPLKRMGVPEDIAPAVGFLLSDGAAYITGHNLMVDGGWTAI